jgi:anti-sigma B factor antagonist
MRDTFSVEVLGHGRHIAMTGRLDGRAAPIARAVLYTAVEDGEGDLTVQASGLEIWDAAGMGVLVGAHARARRRDRRLLLVDVPERQLRLLRATRLGRVLAVQPRAVA